MTKDNSTGKNKDFYDLGKKMFDRINPLGHTTSRWSGKVDRTTPPEREWVGLTVDELIDLEQEHMRHEDLSRAIEAKLKEKNT
jgi:hypothetical protein